MAIAFEVSEVIQAKPETLYDAWLDSEQHAKMTGGAARVSAQVGGKFNAWDGYISGENVALEAPRRITQKWRTTEFDDADGDSMLEIEFMPEGDGTRVTIRHSNLPADGMQYKQGWVDAYFTPMKAYFEK